MKRVILLVICFMLLSAASYSAVIRVKTDGIDTNDGSSWELAKKTVTAALTASISGDEIWVASGTYIGNINLRDGVKLYGGFVGNETALEQRDWKNNVTVLDGNATGSVVASRAGVTNTARIDGFTIRNGKSTFYGGGIYCDISSPTIANNIITGNNAGAGGGIYCYAYSPVIINNTITGNNATYDGGGILCVESSPAVITSNTITGNNAQNGGGISCSYSVPSISSNIITGNTAQLCGGGIRCLNSSPAISNNTIAGNSSSSTYGGGIDCDASSPTISNNIIAFNSSGINKTSGTGTPSLRNNCVFNPSGDNYTGISAGTGDISLDPMFVDRANGNYHLSIGSPCINAGYDPAVAAGWVDIDEQSRIMGSSVDIGADEFLVKIIRVSTTGNDTNDGSSWELAKRTVQAALDAASKYELVWVAAGTYVERMELKDDVKLYGGFAGTETLLSQRNWKNNVTVLDGSALGSVITSIAGVTNTARIDGFTIRNGVGCRGGGINCISSSPTIANNIITGNYTDEGAGINCGNSSSPVITNNTITGNISRWNGSGINCVGSSPVISNNTIAGNIAYNNGGGIYCDHSSPSISSNIITANTGSSSGGIGCYYSSPAIVNNTIAGNSSDSRSGGGIDCIASSPVISNNIISFNSSGINKSNGAETPTLRNNCVYNPGGADYIGISAGTGDISVDPKLVSIEYGQVHIKQDSPCKNAGSDTDVVSGSLDIDGNARLVGFHVDIGADEYNGTIWTYTQTVIRVSTTGDDANNGSSWALAKKTVQAAINDASVSGGNVWVAKGIYNERITLKPYAYLYGGFAGTETSLNQRNWRDNASILDGGTGGNVVTVDRIGHITSRIDGFTIRNGNALLPIDFGGGIYCKLTSPTITNNTITSNRAGSTGGGIFCRYSSSSIQNNIITGNVAGSGGGIFCAYCSTTIKNNIITGNTTTTGGGITCDNGSPVITNNTIAGNSANGGAIYCLSQSPLSRSIISNNIIAFNSSGIYGPSPILRNNCVYNPGGPNYGGVLPGTGDISADPMFVDRTNGNYHLSIGSPCINTGYDDAVGTSWLDMDLQSRIMGTHVDMGADEISGSKLAVGTAKGISDGLTVSGYGAVITAVFGDSFYIESANRSSGIRVDKAGHDLDPDMAVDIDGVLATSADGERYIAAKSAIQCGVGNIKPMYMINKCLGGALSIGQIGVEAGSGLNNIGLLVKLTGFVKQISGGFFILDDGSIITDPSGANGVRVIYADLDSSKLDKLVSVEGISSIIKDNNKYYRCLRAVNVTEIDTAQ